MSEGCCPAPNLVSNYPKLQLTHLDIHGCHRACSPAAFDCLSQLTSLRRLGAEGCRLQPSAVATLACLTNLQASC